MSTRRAALVSDLNQAIRRMVVNAVLSNQHRADALNLNATDLQLLNLVEMSPLTPKALAQATGLSTGGITVALDRLEKTRYIKRERNANDRRSVLIHFLPKPGHPIYAQYKDVTEHSQRVYGKFSDKEIALLTHLINEMLAASP